jgi:phospholipid-binding lipoprotein MlaA
MQIFRFFYSSSVISAALLFITGCTMAPISDPHDPLEPINRQFFKFNMAMDQAVLRPLAVVYDKVIPAPVDHGITNFLNNLDDITTTGDDLLQANIPLALSDATRFVINSTLGIAGIFDPATRIGLVRHRQDFGLTLARWGYTNSMYFVIPFFGPSTIRDAVGLPVDYYLLSIYPYIPNIYARYGLSGLYYVNHRAAWLSADKLLYDAFDPYAFVRSAYLQRRAHQMETLRKEGRITHENSSYLTDTSSGNSDSSAKSGNQEGQASIITSADAKPVGNSDNTTADTGSDEGQASIVTAEDATKGTHSKKNSDTAH